MEKVALVYAQAPPVGLDVILRRSISHMNRMCFISMLDVSQTRLFTYSKIVGPFHHYRGETSTDNIAYDEANHPPSEPLAE
jgi:hypothetical protein